MDAEFTNALTNGLHALCLLVYFLAAGRAAQRGDGRFTAPILGFFLLLFVLKMMGVYVHYAPGSQGTTEIWGVLSVGVALLNCLILQALRFPLNYRSAGLLFAGLCTMIFLLRQDFTFLAVEIIVFNLAAALYTNGLLRIGFAGVVVSNLVWILARKGTELYLGHGVPTAWRYDNDLYHLLLIASTFMVYKGFARGDGVPEGRGEVAAEEVEMG